VSKAGGGWVTEGLSSMLHCEQWDATETMLRGNVQGKVTQSAELEALLGDDMRVDSWSTKEETKWVLRQAQWSWQEVMVVEEIRNGCYSFRIHC
jgi:hypothetical protein